jgi:hypothetical protein
MSSVAISGNASGAGVLTIAAPNTASSYTLTLPTATTTLAGTDATQTLTNKTLTSPTIDGTPVMGASVITRGTAVASTSGTSIDFTSIPNWVKRITVMFQGVSTSGTSNLVVRAGTSGGIDSTNYTSNRGTINNTSVFVATTTTGFDVASFASAAILNKGNVILNNITGNVWVSSGCISDSGTQISNFSGTVSLAGVLDRVRITTVNGTDTFDAGSINILYE